MHIMTQPTPGNGLESYPNPEEVDTPMSAQPVEVAIATEIYQSAKQRAHSQGQALAAVARTILFQEAAKTPEALPATTEDPNASSRARPPLRQYGQERTKLKFNAPSEAYQQAQRRILAGGRSVAAAIEDGLKAFAASGNL